MQVFKSHWTDRRVFQHWCFFFFLENKPSYLFYRVLERTIESILNVQCEFHQDLSLVRSSIRLIVILNRNYTGITTETSPWNCPNEFSNLEASPFNKLNFSIRKSFGLIIVRNQIVWTETHVRNRHVRNKYDLFACPLLVRSNITIHVRI